MTQLQIQYFKLKDKYPKHLIWFNFEQEQSIFVVGDCAIQTQRILNIKDMVEIVPNFYQIKFSDYLLEKYLVEVIHSGKQVALNQMKDFKPIETMIG